MSEADHPAERPVEPPAEHGPEPDVEHALTGDEPTGAPVDVGFGVRPGRDRADDVAAAAAAHGGQVGLPGVLARLDRRARRSLAPGLRARRALAWDAEDRRTDRWWPQGVTSAGDAGDPALTGSRRLLVVAWYERDSRKRTVGSRVSVLDLDTRRYAHVRLAWVSRQEGAAPRLAPLRVHAGGLAWRGGWLHVAATARGFWSCHWDDVLLDARGDLVLPVRRSHAAQTRVGVRPMRYSFLSVEHARDDAPAHLVAGEYNRGDRSRRLVRYALDEAGLPVVGPDGTARPVGVPDEGPPRMQGAVRLAPAGAARGGRWVVQTSRGPFWPGSLWAGPTGGTADDLDERRWAVPMGCEDLTHWPSSAPGGARAGLLWSATEHPHRRWVYAVGAD